MSKKELLKRVALFSGLDDKYLDLLAPSCHEKTFHAGDVLVEQGKDGIGLVVISTGKVRVMKGNAGGEQVEVATHGPGEFIGEMTVLDGAPRSASVIAVEDSECLILSNWIFRAAMETHPEIALAILPVVVSRFRETNTQLAALQGA
jgi:CRP/FNR family transcriptional regulator, cyclic AMP receptor protein